MIAARFKVKHRHKLTRNQLMDAILRFNGKCCDNYARTGIIAYDFGCCKRFARKLLHEIHRQRNLEAGESTDLSDDDYYHKREIKSSEFVEYVPNRYC